MTKANDAGRTLRWGVISTADIGVRAVIPALQQSQYNEVLAIASRSVDRAQETAARLGIPRWYGSYEALLQDPELDAVYIPLPNHLHAAWAIRAAEAGKHVLCEKPIALTADEAARMAAAAAAAGVVLAEAFMYRHHPRYQRILDVIAAGEIGRVWGVHGVFTFNNAHDRGNIRFVRAMGGGSLYDVGCYPISAARLLLGEPEAVTVQAYFSPDHDDVDMMAFGLLEFPGGRSATFECGMWGDGRNTLQIVGSDGRIDVPHAFLYPSREAAAFTVTVRGETRVEPVPDVNQYVLQADDFARAVFGLAPPRFPADDAVRNMRVLDACLASARERRRVALAPAE
ncbi:deoxyfructose oxidoreductase [Alicyclobacillus cellulosilyticus]|uniref:Deoxyfructose oxidoreductase n=1 Tax=Alicyclobacillus cellulosilyticus TaxID=1003997 RepID=A0A917KB91_9BACL|nr:Gfo/Idh/MocA family oxidoreductase [Alicyclobacillus cellulosilyticus]GGJ05488.1 deoxyfructose oxidoreductase [Alicyclobacillus cellulosilyticus]